MDASVPLPARTDVSALAARAVASAGAAAYRLADPTASVDTVRIDPDRVAIAYSSERWFRRDGEPQQAFAALSGFFRTRDGWVRTHANYPHHRRALLTALVLHEGADAAGLARALAARDTGEILAAADAQGALCVAVRAEQPAEDAALRRSPLVSVRRVGEAPPTPMPSPAASTLDVAPLRGIRVLDLTRVIAGPVATRTLALLGADVLRIDPPHLPEPANQHLDTGHGKRSALLDLTLAAARARFDELLDSADILALGYRPAALARLGLDPDALAQRHPGLIVLRLTAWGSPDRRGFDSLVQAESGIARIEAAQTGSDGAPGVLPAQALDHSAGYLLASAAMDLLARRAREGGSWLAETSLRRIAAELLGMPRTRAPEPERGLPSPDGHTQTFTVQGHEITTAAPALVLPGGPLLFAAPRPWGEDEPAWAR